MRKATAAFFLMILVLFLFIGIFLYSQSRGLRIKVKNLDSDNEVGKQYLVLIAINRYQHWTPLKGPVKDAEDIRKILESRYYIDDVLKLFNEEATKEGIIKLFKQIQNELKLEDSVLIFYGGHGHLDEASNTAHWIPVDGGLDENKMENWIPNAIIRGLISKIKSKHLLLVSDSCFSGDILKAWRNKRPKLNHESLKKAYKRRSRQALTSGDSERVPDSSNFAKQLKLVLKENKRPYLIASRLYDEICWGIKDTLPMFGALIATNHQEGGAFLLFLKENKNTSYELVADRIIEPSSNTVGDSFKFPSRIEYNIFKNDKQIGKSRFEYRRLVKRKAYSRALSSLKWTDFKVLGYTSNVSHNTYIFNDDMSIYLSSLSEGKEIISQIRLESVIGFDGKKKMDYEYRDRYQRRKNIQERHFFKYKMIDLLSSFFIASQRVASGKYKRREKFHIIINKSQRLAVMRYLGEEKVPFNGKMVETKILAIFSNDDNELMRFYIFKNHEGYCFPVKFAFIERKSVKEPVTKTISPRHRRIFVSNLTFMDAFTQSTMVQTELAALINEVVVKGMQWGQKVDNRFVINEPGYKIPNTDANVNTLVNILFDPNLSKIQKAEKIITEIMEPFDIDVLVTGNYIDDARNPLISIRPMVFVKSGPAVLLKNLQFKKDALECQDPITKKTTLCKSAYDEIARAVKELLEEI